MHAGLSLDSRTNMAIEETDSKAYDGMSNFTMLTNQKKGIIKKKI